MLLQFWINQKSTSWCEHNKIRYSFTKETTQKNDYNVGQVKHDPKAFWIFNIILIYPAAKEGLQVTKTDQLHYYYHYQAFH